METTDWRVNKLSEYLDSEEGKAHMIEYFDRLKRIDECEDRWTDRSWNHIKHDVDFYIEKLITKYESDEYRDREYRKANCEPREPFFWVLFDVAKKYGRECTDQEVDIYANMFTGDMAVIGSYVIQVMHGQGSVIRIDKIS